MGLLDVFKPSAPALPRGHMAREIENALRHEEVPLSRGQRRKLTHQVLAALEQLGYRFG